MAGMALGADAPILMKNLTRNLLLIQVPQGNNPKMVYRILGPTYSSYVRSIYVHSTSEIFADIVPPRHGVIERILALAGPKEYRSKEFTCYIQLASEVMEPDFFRELTQLLIHGSQTPTTLIHKRYFLPNPEWDALRNPSSNILSEPSSESELEPPPVISRSPADLQRRLEQAQVRKQPGASTEASKPVKLFVNLEDPNKNIQYIPSIATPIPPVFVPRTPIHRPIHVEPIITPPGKVYTPAKPLGLPKPTLPVKVLDTPPAYTPTPTLGKEPITPVKHLPVTPPPLTIGQLTQAVNHLDTEDLSQVIGLLIKENRKRLGLPEMPGKPSPTVGSTPAANLPPSGPDPAVPPSPIVLAPTNPFNPNNTLHVPVTPGLAYPELQTSFQAMSEGLLKAALKEGVLRQDTPKLHAFTGKLEDQKASWRRWELQVKGLEGSYSDRAIKEAMNKALQGDAAIVADSLEDDCTWKELLSALKAKFAMVSSLDVMMRDFFTVKQDTDSVSRFAINLEKILGGIRVSHPQALSNQEHQSHLRNRFFHGLQESLRSNLRHKYDTGASYSDLLMSARSIESEQNPTGIPEVTTKLKTKASSLTPVELTKLENAYKTCQGEYRRLQQNMDSYQKTNPLWSAKASQASQFVPPPIPPPDQATGVSNSNQNSKPSNQGGGRGNFNNQPYYRGGYRGRGGYFRGRGRGFQYMPDPPGKPQGWNRLCYWCRDFVSFGDADHKLRDCPLYEKVKKDWWNDQQPSSTGHTHAPTSPPDKQEN